MKTLQKKADLTVEQLAVIIRRLSRADREKLEELTYEVPEWHKKIVQETAEKIRKDPSQLIPLDEFLKRLKSK